MKTNCEIWDKNCLHWVFWGAILKNYCRTCNQSPRICLTATFSSKITKKLIQKCQIWLFCRWNLKTSAPSNFPHYKISWKNKMPRFRTKNTLSEYFWAQIFEKHVWSYHPRIYRKLVLKLYSEFWYRSAFSEGPVSGLGPIYRVCHLFPRYKLSLSVLYFAYLKITYHWLMLGDTLFKDFFTSQKFHLGSP